MGKKTKIVLIGAVAIILMLSASIFILRALYPQPFAQSVQKSGIEAGLVYSIMKAESGFHETAKSSAGAVGIMQIKPSTAQFICERANIPFDAEQLYKGDYNVMVGCAYLKYLFERFGDMKTVLAAYNAGEGTVTKWLNDERYSEDGKCLKEIPYPETRAYVKKVCSYRKTYRLLYRFPKRLAQTTALKKQTKSVS